MARGNLIQGQGSGKIGDVVLMVRNGQQVSRVYTESGARSGKDASEASRIQRVKFGSASNQWSLYRYVCTRMYRKGRTSRQSDYNYFVKRNSKLFPYLTKDENVSGVHVLQPGVFSEGTLGRLELVHYYNPVFAEGTYTFSVFTTSVNLGSYIAWNGLMSAFKAKLQGVLPNARKVTYLFSKASEISLAEGGLSFQSQIVHHHTVTIDLYKEVEPGEDSMTIAQFFSAHVADDSLKTILGAQTASFMGGRNLMNVYPASAEQNEILSHVACLVFVTDDNVDDCYTTILPESSINPTSGVYVDWVAYRTQSSLRVASDSYGYQSGVMRDDIASVGNEIGALITNYANTLKTVDSAKAASFLKSVGDASKVQAKTVRNSTEDSK